MDNTTEYFLNNVADVDALNTNRIIISDLSVDNTVEIIPEESEDDKKLKELLKQFDLEDALPYLKKANVTFRSLQYIRGEDVKEAIPPLGLRVEFREKLLLWKKKEFGIDDETLSGLSRVDDWLQAHCSKGSCKTYTSASSTEVCSNGLLQKDLKSLLNDTLKGKTLLKAYTDNGSLTNWNRDELINIIVEQLIGNNTFVKPHEFFKLVDDICELFPTESTIKEYYFIPRNGKRNPSGKLFAKYVNRRSKRRKSQSPALGRKKLQIPACEQEESLPEIDDSTAIIAKEFLKTESTDWPTVVDKWEKTFVLRQRDLKQLSPDMFLENWPKYTDSREPELINIDFDFLYLNKSNVLINKWENFKSQIKSFLEFNLHNESCKRQFANAKSTTNKDTELLQSYWLGYYLLLADLKVQVVSRPKNQL